MSRLSGGIMTGEKRPKYLLISEILCLIFEKQMSCTLGEKCQKFHLYLHSRWLMLAYLVYLCEVRDTT